MLWQQQQQCGRQLSRHRCWYRVILGSAGTAAVAVCSSSVDVGACCIAGCGDSCCTCGRAYCLQVQRQDNFMLRLAGPASAAAPAAAMFRCPLAADWRQGQNRAAIAGCCCLPAVPVQFVSAAAAAVGCVFARGVSAAIIKLSMRLLMDCCCENGEPAAPMMMAGSTAAAVSRGHSLRHHVCMMCGVVESAGNLLLPCFVFFLVAACCIAVCGPQRCCGFRNRWWCTALSCVCKLQSARPSPSYMMSGWQDSWWLPAAVAAASAAQRSAAGSPTVVTHTCVE